MRLARQLLFFAFVLPLATNAQDWKTVSSTGLNYFSAGRHHAFGGTPFYSSNTRPKPPDTALLRVIYVKSFGVVGADTTFYFFTTMRDSSVGPSGSYTGCIDTLAKSWLGPYFVRRNNGDEYYFNSLSDSILIRTKGPLGDSWTIAKDSMQTHFVGTISQAGTLLVDGVIDSFKTISIQAKRSGVAVPHWYNNMELQISKNQGWLKTLDFFRFPNPVKNTDRHGIAIDSNQHIRLPALIKNPQLGAVDIPWRYAPGNEWIWKHEKGYADLSTTPYITTTTHDSVLSLQTLSASTAVVALRTLQHTAYSRFVPPSASNPSPYYIKYFYDSTYNHSDTIVSSIVFTLSTSIENGWRSALDLRTFVEMYDSGHFFITPRSLEPQHIDYKPSCMRLGPLIGDAFYSNYSTFLQGFGTTANFSTAVDLIQNKVEYGRYLYIKTGLNSYGAKIDVRKLAVEQLERIEESFSIHPNPASTRIILTSKLSGQSLSATLRNITGQIIFQQSFSTSTLDVPTSEVPSGLYFLEVTGKEIRQSFKVVVQH